MSKIPKLSKEQFVYKQVPTGLGGLGLGWALIIFVPMIFSTAALALTTVPVELNPAGASNRLHVQGFKPCKKNDHPGCLLFERGQKGFIKFYIRGEASARTCKEGAENVITQIKVTTEELVTNGGSPNRSKGNFDVAPAPWLKKNAFKHVIENKGIIYNAMSNNGWTEVALENLNNHSPKEGVKHFWYQVTVTNCDDPKKIWITDPRGDNEGRNRH